MKYKFLDIYEPIKWTHKTDVMDTDLGDINYNAFDLSITSLSENDDENMKYDYKNTEIKLGLEKFWITLTQHQTFLDTEEVNGVKMTYWDKDLTKVYTYDLEVRDKESGTTAVFTIALDKMKIISEHPDGFPVWTEKKVNTRGIEIDKYSNGKGKTLEVIQELDDDPFDTDF